MTLLEALSARVGTVFGNAGLDPALGTVQVSDRPDLAPFQCNGALAAAKIAKQNPRALAEGLAQTLRADPDFSQVTVAGPGFLNLTLTDAFLTAALSDDRMVWALEPAQTVVIDYGGPNVAKPLHVGHLRSAIIGEALKRILRAAGATVIADVHLGDWGLQMGQLISEMELRNPALPYFDPAATGPFPTQSPVTLADLESLYPQASAACKADEERRNLARRATFALQDGRPGYRALWQHFVTESRRAIEAEYAELGVSFDLWKGESDAQPLIPEMVDDLKARGLAEESDGALIVRVAREDDNKQMPPVMVITSEGSVGYHTTDLATILDRKRSHAPDRILYVVDQRQALHFEQVFRAADRAGIFPADGLEHLGFGTMNGKDGKPFKTREGGVLRLRDLIDLVTDKARERIAASGMAEGYDDDEIDDIAKKVGVAALKFADLGNPRTSDYIFDIDRFTAFEGKTGPYLLYASVRIRSVLARAGATDTRAPLRLVAQEERDLVLHLLRFADALKESVGRRMPHVLADHAFGLAQAFSKFYAACRIADEDDPTLRESRIQLASRVGDQLDHCLDLFGIAIPARM